MLNLLKSNENYYFLKESNKSFKVGELKEYLGPENFEFDKTWNGTNTITKVQLKDFKIFENLELPFSENINILLGNNGLGKTSILQAITLALLTLENDESPRKLKEFINFKKKEAEISVFWGEECKKMRIYVEGNPEIERFVFPPNFLLLAYGVNFNTNENQDHLKILKQLIEGNGQIYFTESIFNDSTLNFHDPLMILNLLNIEVERINFSKNPSIEKKRAIEVSFLLDSIKSLLNSFLNLIDHQNQIQIIFDESDNSHYFEDFNKNKLEIQQLSEGYKDHILLLTDIIVRILACRNYLFGENIEIDENLLKNSKAVILIDEFDRHLHPVWQRKLLSKFKEVFPNVQFILTTHNPMSILDRDADEIIQLEKVDNEIVAKKHKEGTKYLDISMTYLKYFVNDIVSTELQNDLEKYNEMYLKGSTNSEEFKNLQEKLKNADVGYVITDKRYWKFLDFIKIHPELDPNKNNENAGDWEFSDEQWQELLNDPK